MVRPLYPADARCAGALSATSTGPDAGKIESAQKWIGAQLAGPAQIHQEAHRARAELAEFTRKFVDGGKFIGVVLASEKYQALVAQCAKKFVEGRGETARFFFGVDAALLAIAAQRQRHAQHLGDFLVRQIADKIGEMRQPVELGE